MINVMMFVLGFFFFLNCANTRLDLVESGESSEQIDFLVLGLLTLNR